MKQQVAVERKKRDIIFFTLLTLCLLYFAISLLFGNMGFLKYEKLRKTENRIRTEINGLEKENKVLKAQVHALRDDNFYIEKYAREEYGLARPDEYIFQFSDNGK